MLFQEVPGIRPAGELNKGTFRDPHQTQCSKTRHALGFARRRMTRNRAPQAFIVRTPEIAVAIGLAALFGCGPATPGLNQFRTSFLPPATAPKHVDAPQPPRDSDIPKDLFRSEKPALTQNTQTTRRPNKTCRKEHLRLLKEFIAYKTANNKHRRRQTFQARGFRRSSE